MSHEFDYVVIGSGFGGSVMSARLAEKGYRVTLLERGKRYGFNQFPRRVEEIRDKFFWDPKNSRYGVMEFRDYPEGDLMSVTASGLGGGSLIYANVMVRMPDEFFAEWPSCYNAESLEPHYVKVRDVLDASPYPFAEGGDKYYQDTPKTAAFKQAAEQLEKSDDALEKPEFFLPDLAINFKGTFPGEQMVNKHGAIQSKCNKCGECDIGCNIHAKNTLDLNYLKIFENLGGNIQTETEVDRIIPRGDGGYDVHFFNPENPTKRGIIGAKGVILSAGSLGSTTLLLKMKRAGILPHISEKVGYGWCGNGDLEGTAIQCQKPLTPTEGPVITGGVKYRFKAYPDGFAHGAYIQDAGIPIGLGWYLAAKIPSPQSIFGIFKFSGRLLKGLLHRLLRQNNAHDKVNIGEHLRGILDKDHGVANTFLLLGMGRDRSDGRIEIREDGEPVIKWKIDQSRLHYQRLSHEMKKITARLGGLYFENPLSMIDKIIAVHPIGGCCMGDNQKTGVVDERGEVFGYRNLHVIDAAILPSSVGPNPSMTIAAVAEFIAAKIPPR